MDIIRFVDRIGSDPLNANPDFDVDVSSWLAVGGTITRSTAQVFRGTGSMLLTPDGVGTKAEGQSEGVPVTASSQYRPSAWVHCAVGREVGVHINWYDASDVYMSTTSTTATVAASTWTFIEGTHTAPVGAAEGRLIVGMGSTPSPSHLLYVDRAAFGGADGAVLTRLDLNDGTTWGVTYDGTDFSPPPLKSAWSNTLLSDGERLSAAAYANRTITLSLDLITSTPDDAAAQLQLLWRELNRPSNFLMWQPDGATQPVFFRTMRSSNTRVTEYPSGDIRTVEVTVDAEPFAYGLREQLSTVTITNSPVSGTNPMYLDVSAPKGDVETPLYLRFQGSAISTTQRWLTAIAVRRRGTPANLPFVLPAQSMSLATNAASRHIVDSSSFTSTLNANPTFETNVSDWTATGGAIVRDTTAHYDFDFSPSTASMKFTPTGGIATVSVQCGQVVLPDTTSTYCASAWIACAVSRTVSIGINWYTSGGAFISTTSQSYSLAGVYVDAHVAGTPPPTAARATIVFTMTGTPPNTHVLWVDNARLGKVSAIGTKDMPVDTTGVSNAIASISTFPTSATVDARGTYRVFMRHAVDFLNYYATLHWGGVANSEVLLAQSEGGYRWAYADMGLVQIPGGYDPVYDGISGSEVTPQGIFVQLKARRTESTSGDVYIDHFLFMPADDRLLLIRWPELSSTPTDIVLDSLNGQVYARNASSQVTTMQGAELAGGPPMVSPGVNQRVYIALDVGQALIPASMSTTVQVTPHYWPRYLTVRGATA